MMLLEMLDVIRGRDEELFISYTRVRALIHDH